MARGLRKTLVLPALFAGLSLCACTKKNKVLEYGLPLKDTIRINLSSEPPSLDWLKGGDTTSSTVTGNIMEGLVDYDLTDPSLPMIPGLAESWKPSEGARVWTLTLRKGVKWTDGVEFTGRHVVDAWERLLNPATASEYAYFLFPLKNAQAYNEGRLKDFSKVGVRIDDKGRLIVELERPMGYFPMLLAHHSTFPVRKDVIERYGDQWTEPGHIQTLGAYKLKIWDHDKAIVLERYDGYYREKAKTRYILGYMINEYATALNLYGSGKLDFQETLPAKELPALRKLPGFHSSQMLATYFLGFNTKKAPFTDVKVRRAFTYAIDRKQITNLLNAGHVPMFGWLPEGMLAYDPTVGLRFDPQRAARLMDEAGYKDRSKLPKIVFSFNTNENHQRIAENVQAQLKRNLGVEIQLANEEWKVYLNRLHTDAAQMYRMGWQADYPDPDTFMNMMTTVSDNNYSHWGSPRYDRLIDEAASATDPTKRAKLYIEAQKILTEKDVPVIPVYIEYRSILLSTRLKNFPLNPLNRWIFKGASVQ